jgi:hypothetical protein
MSYSNSQYFVRKATIFSPHDLVFMLIKKIIKLNFQLAQY